MATELEVQAFLNDFLVKLKIWDILYRDDRKKNIQTLLDLEITKAQRKETIASLEFVDYSAGPLEDILNNDMPLWVFGKMLKKKLIYIKITLGSLNNPVICISFHEAEHAMPFPFKTQKP
jgi:hypothetical protein